MAFIPLTGVLRPPTIAHHAPAVAHRHNLCRSIMTPVPSPILVSSEFTSSTLSPSFMLRPARTMKSTTRMSAERTAKPTSITSSGPSEGRRHALVDFIMAGPIYQRAGLVIRPVDSAEGCTTNVYETCIEDWMELAKLLEDALGNQSNDIRVYQYYLPVYFWILRELDLHTLRLAENNESHRPFLLGFSCPQGGGKTTMTTFMKKLLNAMGRVVEIASLDDFYVTNAEQGQIAAKYPDNPLMQFRGMPGTHDMELLTSTLDALRHGEDVLIPRYDKSAFEGRGDRAPKQKWKSIKESADVVLLEGWCLGFEPVGKDQLHNEHLGVVNDALEEFPEVYNLLDGLFLIEIENMDWVFEWRLQAERSMRAAGRPALSDEQVTDFVSRFMPAYKEYSQQLYRRPTPLIPEHELHIQIDQERRPIHQNY